MTTNLTDISGFLPPGPALADYLAQVGSFEAQCQTFMLADLAKSGLSPTNFPCVAGSINKYEGTPYYSIKFPGSNYAMDRVKREDAKYIFPKGALPELYYPLGVTKEVFSTANYTAVVEGQKKAAAFAHATGVPALGIPGVSGWSVKLESVTKHLEHRNVRNELLSGVGSGRFHIICVDGDWSDNEQIAKELATYASEAAGAGSTPIAPDFGQNAKGERRGADDWLVETYGGILPSQDVVLRDILALPRVDLSILPVLAGFYTSDIEKFNRGHIDKTDRGNATLLLRLYGAGNLLFLHDTKTWAVYTDAAGKWTQYPEGALELVNPAALQYKHLSDSYYRQLEAFGLSEERKKHLEAQAKSCYGSYSALSFNSARKAVLEDLKTREGVRVSANRFDTDEFILNTPSGVVDLRTGKLRPVERNDYVLRSTAVPYQEDEPTGPEALKIKKWLVEVTADEHAPRDAKPGIPFAGNPKEHEYFLRVQGAALRGSNPTTSLNILWGVGSSSKSVWSTLDLAMLGTYGTTVPAATVLAAFGSKRDPEAAAPFLSSTRGRRKVYMPETSDTAWLDEPKVKMLTGGDAIAARGNYKDADAFKATATMQLVTNNLPNVNHMDAALQDRLKVLGFMCRWQRPDVTLRSPGDELLPMGDRWFIDHAHNSKDGLAWLLWAQVQAGVRYYKEGTLGPSPRAVAITSSYVEENDLLAKFAGERKLVFGPDEKVKAQKLYEVYCNWFEKQNHSKTTAVSKNVFKKRVLARFPTLQHKEHGNGHYMHYLGVSVPDRQIETETD